MTLSIVVALLLCSEVAMGNELKKEQFDLAKNDTEFVLDITENSRQMTLSAIKAKWLELKKMLQGSKSKESTQHNTQGGILSEVTDSGIDSKWGTTFRIFVSSSMSKNLLKSYAKQAKKYDAVLVFNGLPRGSWQELSKLVMEISRDEHDVTIQIDDEAFAQFNIREVPSFVLSKEEDVFAEHPKVTFDKVTGSIGIRRVLELFQEQGQLQEIATSKLEEGEAAGRGKNE